MPNRSYLSNIDNLFFTIIIAPGGCVVLDGEAMITFILLLLLLLKEIPHEVGELFHLFYLDVPNIGNPEGIDVTQLAWVDGKA